MHLPLENQHMPLLSCFVMCLAVTSFPDSFSACITAPAVADTQIPGCLLSNAGLDGDTHTVAETQVSKGAWPISPRRWPSSHAVHQNKGFQRSVKAKCILLFKCVLFSPCVVIKTSVNVSFIVLWGVFLVGFCFVI